MPRLLAQLSRRTLTVYRSSAPPARLCRPSISASPSALLSTTSSASAKDPNSTPGWEGRSTEGIALNRSKHDPQSEGAQEGIKEREQGKTASQAVSGKGGSANKKAKEENPEAPEPVIGMNEERGEKPQ